MQEDCDIILGPELTLRSIPRLTRQLGLGMSERTVRLLCQALSVPCVQVGKTWYVNIFWFKVSLHAATRIGESDFLTPGCEQLKQGRMKETETRSIDPTRLRANLRAITAELVAIRHSRALKGGEDKIESRTQYIAQRLSDMTAGARDQFSNRSLTAAADRDTIPHHYSIKGPSPWNPPLRSNPSSTPSPSTGTSSSSNGTSPAP